MQFLALVETFNLSDEVLAKIDCVKVWDFADLEGSKLKPKVWNKAQSLSLATRKT